ncbi:unnamed protein product [Pelagomonas calceolata]|uniref:Uncharacterized protein n=1 Tax=Pelagomonas calceolata TaxID=35677 RepID=A0A7S4A5H9_9STRA|nr:unnamed protein product [Pelagomonas calceolata]
MSSDQPPSLRLELAAATAQWAVRQGAALHEHLRLEERDGRGICLVAADAIDANATIIRIPRTLCVTSDAARKDEDVRRVLGGDAHESFGALLLLTLKLLQKPEGPYLQYLELIADATLLRPPSIGGGPLREALWKAVHAQDQAFDQAFAPTLRGDPCFGGVDATFYALCRKLVETRAFQLDSNASSRIDSVQALVPVMDLVNYARDCGTRLVIADDVIELRATSILQGEICWDYSGPQKAPLDVLTQYGFFSTGLNVRHVVPLRSEALGQLLDNASMVPIIEGARDTMLRRRRAVAVRFCVDLEQPPILEHRREAPSQIIFWVDAADPLASPLALALRAALADDSEVFERDRTVKAWVVPINAEATVTRALRDCALAVVEELSSDTGPVVEYQREQLSKLAARLA